MGYRSNVAVALSEEYYDKLIELCKNDEKFNKANVYGLITEADSIYYRDECYLFIYNSIKWYDNFDEVKLFQNYVEDAISEDGSNNCFVRIGEEDDDNECIGYSDTFEVGIVREITYSI